jgi:hypothetical protein
VPAGSAPQPPSDASWLHEIKHDGFQVIAHKDGKPVKLDSRHPPARSEACTVTRGDAVGAIVSRIDRGDIAPHTAAL